MTADFSDGLREPLLNKSISTYRSIPPTSAPRDAHKLSRTDVIWVLVALWSTVFLAALDGTIVATLVTSIGSHFDKAHHASYLGTSYLLSVCCFTPLYGRLSDIIGRKGAMLIAVSLFGVGTILCGLAPSMNTLIAARAIAGMGGGGVGTVTSIAMSDLVPLKKRGLYQGFTNIMFAIGSGMGGPLGGIINDRFGWRWAFLCQIPVLVLSWVLVMLKLNIKSQDEEKSTRFGEKLKRMDYLGSLTLVLAVSSLLFAVTLNSSEEIPWTHPYIWGLMLSFIAFTVIFVLVETHVAAEPVMPLRLLRERTPLAVAMSNFLLSVVSFSMLYNVPVYFTAVRLMSSTDAGLRLIPNSLAIGCGSVAAGFIMRRTGKVYNLTLASAGLILLSSTLVAQWSDRSAEWHLWIDVIPNGIGIASLLTTTLIALIAAVDQKDVAVATGISYLFRTTGQVLGVSLTGALLQGVLMRNLRERIVGPGSFELIQAIRHSTTIIPSLDPPLRQAAVESYAFALRAVFIVQTALAMLTVLACVPIEENPLPGSHEEKAKHDEQRRQGSGSGNSV